MDIFYKPAMQRPDECRALEENYMNCLLQKALKDKVMNNRCVLDSILWYHLECPKDVAKFDDPVEFKRKWRNFFAQTKASAELIFNESDSLKRVQQEFGHVQYPEDVKEKISLRSFPDEFKHLSPILYPDLEGELDDPAPDRTVLDQDCDENQREYGKKLAGFDFDTEDLSVKDSAKFSAQL